MDEAEECMYMYCLILWDYQLTSICDLCRLNIIKAFTYKREARAYTPITVSGCKYSESAFSYFIPYPRDEEADHSIAKLCIAPYYL